MAQNKVNFGLKGAHYAVIDESVAGTVTYGTPKPLPGSVSITLEPQGETSNFYADNITYYTTSTNQGYEATLELAAVTEEFRTEVLGETLETTDKVLVENANTNPKKIALMFEFDGDVKATRHLLVYCTVSRTGLTGATKTESSEPGTTELTLAATPRPTDGVVKISTSAETDTAIYDAWYTAVYE